MRRANFPSRISLRTRATGKVSPALVESVERSVTAQPSLPLLPDILRMNFSYSCPHKITKSSMSQEELGWKVYPVEAYHAMVKPDAATKPVLSKEALRQRTASYISKGMRYSVGAALLAHRGNAPHLLLLEDTETRATGFLSGKVKSWEEPVTTLSNKLAKLVVSSTDAEATVGALVGVFWRTDIDSPLLPYLPIHVSRPKECMQVYQVVLPVECSLCLPPGVGIRAVSFGDLLLDVGVDPATAGMVAAVSRFKLKCFEEETNHS